MYQNVIIPHLYEARHVLGQTPPIIRSLKLHWQPLVFNTWRVVGPVVGGRCQVEYHTLPESVHQLHVQQLSTYEKPEAASAVLGSWWWAVCRPKHVEYHTLLDSVHQLNAQQPSAYEKPEAASAVLGSWWWAVCRPKHVGLYINMD